MTTADTYITIRVSSTLAHDLPVDPDTRTYVLELGLRQWRVADALEHYRQGHGSLAYAAEQAGVSIREMISLAYAHGLTPPGEPEQHATPLTLNQAAEL